MKNLLCLFAGAALVTMLVTGCTSTSPEEGKDKNKKDEKKPELENIIAKSKTAQVKPFAEKYVNSLLDGLKEEDYSLFTSYLTPEMKENITKQAFKTMCEKFNSEKGEYQRKIYLGELDQGVFKVFLWKAVFTKDSDKDVAPDRRVGRDVLVKLIIGQVAKKYMIFGFFFQ